MSKSIPCPTCGVHLMPPRWPSVETTTYSDDCACSDLVICVSHQIGGEPPIRPSHEEMTRRATERLDRETALYESKLARFRSCYPDDPQMDATDGAHPAWWRGHDYVSEKLLEIARAGEKKGEQYQTLALQKTEALEKLEGDLAVALGLAEEREGQITPKTSTERIVQEARYLYEWREAILDGLNWEQAAERATSRSRSSRSAE